jgi:HAE1 family hydrophobic/amphiphilic exporter-1
VPIDYANRLRAEGLERTEALLTAAERRFRPIMMTALTTICAMVPVTLVMGRAIRHALGEPATESAEV